MLFKTTVLLAIIEALQITTAASAANPGPAMMPMMARPCHDDSRFAGFGVPPVPMDNNHHFDENSNDYNHGCPMITPQQPYRPAMSNHIDNVHQRSDTRKQVKHSIIACHKVEHTMPMVEDEGVVDDDRQPVKWRKKRHSRKHDDYDDVDDYERDMNDDVDDDYERDMNDVDDDGVEREPMTKPRRMKRRKRSQKRRPSRTVLISPPNSDSLSPSSSAINEGKMDTKGVLQNPLSILPPNHAVPPITDQRKKELTECREEVRHLKDRLTEQENPRSATSKKDQTDDKDNQSDEGTETKKPGRVKRLLNELTGKSDGDDSTSDGSDTSSDNESKNVDSDAKKTKKKGLSKGTKTGLAVAGAATGAAAIAIPAIIAALSNKKKNKNNNQDNQLLAADEAAKKSGEKGGIAGLFNKLFAKKNSNNKKKNSDESKQADTDTEHDEESVGPAIGKTLVDGSVQGEDKSAEDELKNEQFVAEQRGILEENSAGKRDADEPVVVTPPAEQTPPIALSMATMESPPVTPVLPPLVTDPPAVVASPLVQTPDPVQTADPLPVVQTVDQPTTIQSESLMTQPAITEESVTDLSFEPNLAGKRVQLPDISIKLPPVTTSPPTTVTIKTASLDDLLTNSRTPLKSRGDVVGLMRKGDIINRVKEQSKVLGRSGRTVDAVVDYDSTTGLQVDLNHHQ